MSHEILGEEKYSQYMQDAIQESYKARGIASPNPPVGAIIYDSQGVLCGRGYTHSPGEMHAEIAAIHDAGESARGGTLVVTLEPCNHYGRTPPCVQAIINAGISTVVYGLADPTPLAQGGGNFLATEKIKVIAGVEADAIKQGPLREWLFQQNNHRPHFSAKIAMSMDGKVTDQRGKQSWLTGMVAREHAHHIRAESDAILVGTSTVLIDNPQLTARFAKQTARFAKQTAHFAKHRIYSHQPTRIVVGNREIPENYYVHDDQAITRFIPRSSPRELVNELADYTNILIEGGPTLIHQFMQCDLIDRYYLYLAPIILGQGVNAFIEGSLDKESLRSRKELGGGGQISFPQNFIPHSVEQLNKDICITLLRV